MIEDLWPWISSDRLYDWTIALGTIIAALTGLYTARAAWLDQSVRRRSNDPVLEISAETAQRPLLVRLRVRNRWDSTLVVRQIAIVRPRGGTIAIQEFRPVPIEVSLDWELAPGPFSKKLVDEWRVKSSGTARTKHEVGDEANIFIYFAPPDDVEETALALDVSIDDAGASYRRRRFRVSSMITCVQRVATTATKLKSDVSANSASRLKSIFDSMSG